jgi:GntR family transcriptional regulator, transcriptional repressor for pyruvate dehydrogenase complex
MSPEDISAQPPIRRPPARAQEVVDRLVEKIRAGILKVGEKLPTEIELVEEFAVSRTVVREAVQRLQTNGLVETRHGVGSFVLPGALPAVDFKPAAAVGRRDVFAILELRICIEAESAALAASRASREDHAEILVALEEIDAHARAGEDPAPYDFRFHMRIAQATGNAYFVDVLTTLDPAFSPRARLDPAHYSERVNTEHLNIYEAIARRDPEAARAAMRMHLSNSLARMRR